MKKAFVLIAFALCAGAAFAQNLGGPGNLRRGLLNRPGMGARNAQPAGGAAASAGSMTAEDLKNVPKGTNGVPNLAFDKAPLELVLDAYAEIAEKTILKAPDLPKTEMDLKSQPGLSLTKEEYLEAIERILTLNGIVLEPRGKNFLYVFPRKTVRTQGIRFAENMPTNALPERGRVVSQMIWLQNMTAEEAQKALEGFKDPSTSLIVFERTNRILVTDTQENVNRMVEIVKSLDVAAPVTEDVFVRQVRHAVAADIKTALETIVTESQKEDQKGTSGPKASGGGGFSRQQPAATGSRLLNLNNRPGQNNAPKPNETMMVSSDADRGMIRGKVLILSDERSNKLIVITNKSNMDFFDRVIETLDVETDPEFKVDVVRLRFADAEEVASMLNDLIGGTSSSSSSKANQNQNAKNAKNTKSNLTQKTGSTPPASTAGSPANKSSGSVGDLNKDNCKVLADKRINGIVVMTRTELMPIIRGVIDNMDIKLSQVLIETVIIEVGLGDDIATGIDWLQRGKTREASTVAATDAYGRQLYYAKDTEGNILANTLVTESGYYPGTQTASGYSASEVSATKTVYKTIRDDLVNHNNYALGGGGGKNVLAAATGASSNAFEVISAYNPSAAGLNYFLKSDKLNLAAVIQASKSDSRSKYLASPVIMTVDNKEATIEATQMRYLLTGFTSSSSYNYSIAVPNYEQKEIGITIKITPKINPDGTVMLTVEEEYSQVGEKQTIQTNSGDGNLMNVQVPTTVTRKMSADVSLDNRQTVVLGGLTQTSLSESDTGIPFLKDIPWIGKYLFGQTSSSESRSELLVFMTPYVLDDAESAQMEALRRKRALGDARPWEDNGWSASKLADPVSKKEQLRRFQDEWKRQDEERQTKLAIEKAKFERAKKLEKMTEEERKAWLEVHKDQLEKEQQEEFEKTAKEQKDLKGFVENLKRQDLEKAEKEIQANDRASQQENEYHKELKRMEKDGKLPAGQGLHRDAAEAKKEKTTAEIPAKDASGK